MQITFTRSLSTDAPWLESTWPHVSESEGVRLQLQEEIDYVPTNYFNHYHHSFMLRFVELRRIVTGTFHPGRRILPNSAITYELVYECVTTSEDDVADDNTLWTRVRTMLRDAPDLRASYQQGNQTAEKAA